MSSKRRPKALLIAGPTASGKSAFSLGLARSRGGVVINANSMQVYRDMRILTARPPPAEEALVPHRLYGHVSAFEPYSVARWLDEVAREISSAEAAGLLPIIIGGTGLYFKALLEGLSPVPPIPDAVRGHWRAAGSTMSADALYAALLERDPLTAGQLRRSDRQRLVRALEVYEATGKPLAQWQQVKGTPLLSAGDVVKLVIARDREELYERSARRFDLMLEQGALEEADRMRQLQLSPGQPAARALGLAPLMAFLSGEMTRDEAVASAKRDTRHYIKRQMTWLRRYMISWNWLSTQEMQSQADNCFPIIDLGN